MTETNKKIDIRCRAIIVHDGKLLVVRHSEEIDYYALPGGHLEWGENPVQAMRREIIEELGIEPKIDRLLYINNFVSAEFVQSIEFFFEVANSADYVEINKLTGSHRFELVAIDWLEKNDNKKLLPEQVQTDFNDDTILSDIPRFID